MTFSVSEPRLSVLMAVRNGARTLDETLRHLQNALAFDPSCEVIAVDDGSTDESLAILRRYPLTVIACEKSIGLAQARNRAIAAARGSFVTFLDQDDLPVPGNFEARLAYLEAHPDQVAVAGEIASLIDSHGQPLGDFYSLSGKPRGPRTLDWESVKNGGNIPGAIWLYLFRRPFLQSLEPLRSEWEAITDQEFLYRALQRQAIAVAPIPVAHYRLHGSNATVGWAQGALVPNPRVHALGSLLALKFGITPASP